MAAESDEAFRSQFDRNSKDYHKGVETTVPLGGARVPDAMKDHANWQNMPVHDAAATQPEVSYGPEYEAKMKLRNDLGELKKAISSLSIPVESVMKLRQTSADDPALPGERQKRDGAVQELLDFKLLFPEGSEFGEKCAVVDEIAKQVPQTEEMTQEQYMEYMMMVRRHTQKIFNEQKALLERIKQIKKAAMQTGEK